MSSSRERFLLAFFVTIAFAMTAIFAIKAILVSKSITITSDQIALIMGFVGICSANIFNIVFRSRKSNDNVSL